ncbi:hypothetical protein [Ruegeria sp.]|uniref:hypothetical protein n=1 Tax=Ruegeria sp. TaxID=1879320 RepID=UPI003B001EE6
MTNELTIKLSKLEVPKEDLEKMPASELAFLSTLAFAIDEISVFLKLIIQTFKPRPSSEEFLAAYQIQQNTLMRVLNAKCFEALKIVEQYKKQIEREGDSSRLEKLSELMVELDELAKREEYELAKDIRDHSTNHYLSSETKKNVAHLSSRSTFTAYLHENLGNSFHPFGEEYVFLARIGRHFSEKGDASYSVDDIKKWIDWGLAVGDQITKIFQRYLLWLYSEKFPHWRLEPLLLYLENELVGKIGISNLPIILSADAYFARKTKTSS